jgi:hypothetical protein
MKFHGNFLEVFAEYSLENNKNIPQNLLVHQDPHLAKRAAVSLKAQHSLIMKI